MACRELLGERDTGAQMTKLQRYEEAQYGHGMDPHDEGEWYMVVDVADALQAAVRTHCTCGGREREDPRACVACRIWYQMEVGQ